MLYKIAPFEPAARVLETARLSIRVDTLEEYVEKFRTTGDDELKAYFGIETDAALEVQKQKVSGGLATYRTSVIFFYMMERSLSRVVGSFAFHNWYPAHRRAEAGYAMSADEYKSKGYMSEAMMPIISFGFREMNLHRIEAFIHPGNIPSLKLVQRAGFIQEGILRDRYIDEGVTGDAVVYALLRSTSLHT